MSHAESGGPMRTMDWRAAIRLNQRKTKCVLGAYILIYLGLGFLFDVYIHSESYVLGFDAQDTPLSDIVLGLLQGHIFPYALIVSSVIAVFSICIAFVLHDKLILLGTRSRVLNLEDDLSLKERQFYHVVEEMKVAAGLAYMPKLYIIEADYMNAFASGYSEKSALIAVTQRLLDQLDREELTAVVAHELTHIRHLDIKVTLMASVLSNLLLMLIDILFFWALPRSNSRAQRGGNGLFIAIMILRYTLPVITVLLALFLSRTREYMADAGCVELMRNNEPLAKALKKIAQDHQLNRTTQAQAYRTTPHEAVRREAYIFDPMKAGVQTKQSLTDFFSTHPGIDKRLKALGCRSVQDEHA